MTKVTSKLDDRSHFRFEAGKIQHSYIGAINCNESLGLQPGQIP